MINLLFDFDGTLFDSSLGIFTSFDYACKLCNLESPDRELFTSFIGPPVGVIANNLFPFLSESLHREFVSIFRSHYDSIGYQLSKPYEDIHSLLESIYSSSNFSLPSIVTNKPTLPTLALLDEFSLLHYFDHVIGIDYLSTPDRLNTFPCKQSAIVFLTSLAGLSGMKLYIGDTLSDRDSAKGAGCQFLAVNYGFHQWSQEDKTNITCVDSVPDLSKYLLNQ